MRGLGGVDTSLAATVVLARLFRVASGAKTNQLYGAVWAAVAQHAERVGAHLALLVGGLSLK